MRRVLEPFRAFNHLVIAALAGTVSGALVDVFGKLWPGADEGYLTPLCLAGALLAAIVTGAARQHDALSLSWIRQRLPELIGLAIAARAVGWMWHLAVNPAPESALVGASWADWLFGAGFAWAYPAIATAWFVSAILSARFAALEPDERLIALEQDGSFVVDRASIREGIVNTLIGLGLVVVLFSALGRIGSPDAPDVWRIVAYFLLAFVLLAQSRLALLRLLWARERVDTQPGLSRRWAFLALAFLAVLALAILPLSTGYARDLLSATNAILNALVFGLSVVAWLIVAAVTALLAGLYSLFAPGFTAPSASPPPRFETRDLINVDAATIDLRPILLALLVGAALIFTGRRLWTYRREIGAWLARGRLGGRLLEALRWLVGRFREAAGAARHALEARRTGPAGPRLRERLGLRSAGPMTSRERVLFFYRALLRRSAESGLARGPGQTPAEFARRLEPALPPEGVEAVNALTEGYQTARYSRAPIGAADANRARSRWEKAREALRRRARMG